MANPILFLSKKKKQKTKQEISLTDKYPQLYIVNMST